MADNHEPDGRRPTRRDAGSNETDRVVFQGEHPTLPKRGRHASDDAIKIVSGLLSAKKTAFNRPSKPPLVTLPDVSGSLAEVVRRLKAPPNSRAKFDLLRTSLDAPPLNLPDGGRGDGPKSDGLPPRERSTIEPPGCAHTPPAIGADGGSTPSRGFKIETSICDRVPHVIGADGGSTPTGRDVAPPMTAPAKPLDSMKGIGPSSDGGNPRHRVSGAAGGIGSRFGSMHVGALEPPVDRSITSASSGSVAVDLPREPIGASAASDSRHLGDVSGLGSGLSSLGMAVDQLRNSAHPAESSMNFIRNPLSADLRNFSLANPVLPDSSGGLPDRGGMGITSDQNAFGATASPQGNPSIDLSKTNELLQQLVDAVRKQRASSLPVGGPSVYPDR